MILRYHIHILAQLCRLPFHKLCQKIFAQSLYAKLFLVGCGETEVCDVVMVAEEIESVMFFT